MGLYGMPCVALRCALRFITLCRLVSRLYKFVFDPYACTFQEPLGWFTLKLENLRRNQEMDIALPLAHKNDKGQWEEIVPRSSVVLIAKACGFGLSDSPLAEVAADSATDTVHGPAVPPVNLQVTLLDARGLITDAQRPLRDPYVVVVVGDQRRTSSCFLQTTNAVWNETFGYAVLDPQVRFVLQCILQFC